MLLLLKSICSPYQTPKEYLCGHTTITPPTVFHKQEQRKAQGSTLYHNKEYLDHRPKQEKFANAYLIILPSDEVDLPVVYVGLCPQTR